MVCLDADQNEYNGERASPIITDDDAEYDGESASPIITDDDDECDPGDSEADTEIDESDDEVIAVLRRYIGKIVLAAGYCTGRASRAEIQSLVHFTARKNAGMQIYDFNDFWDFVVNYIMRPQ